MNKSICFVVTSLRGGGAERNVSILANHFSKRGYLVHILTLFSKEINYVFDPSVIIHPICLEKHKSVINVFKWKRMIAHYVKNNKIDTVIGIGLTYGIICAFSLLFYKRINLIVRGTSTCKLTIFEKVGSIFFGHRINTYVAQTEAQKNSLPSIIQKRCLVISNPFLVFESNQNEFGFESKKFISVGRLDTTVKCQQFIIQAFAEFRKKTNDSSFKLCFYGSDFKNGNSKEMFLKIIHDLKIDDYVELHDFTLDLSNSIRNSFFFICSSRYEGMPNALIESQLLGIPAISSSWDGSNEIINDGFNGFLYGNCENVSSLCERLIFVSKLMKKEYMEYSNHSFLHNKDKYDEAKVINTWIDVIERNIKRR